MTISPNELMTALQLPAAMNESDGSSIEHVERPWYISFLLGASGWVAGLFVLLFIGLLFRPDSQPAFLLCGAVLVASAWGLYKADREGAFVAQLALAFSVAGQILLVMGLVSGNAAFASIAFVALIVQVILVFIMPNALHRTLSTLFACAALAATVRYSLFAEMLQFGNSASLAETSPTLVYALAGWAITWLPIAALTYWLIRYEARWMARGWQAIIRPALTGLIIGLAFATLISQPFELFGWSGRNSSDRGWLALWPLLSALAATAAVAAGFALRSRALMGIGIIGALLHISHFYYALGTTLLMKSLIMLLMGAAMLGLAYLLKSRGEPA